AATARSAWPCATTARASTRTHCPGSSNLSTPPTMPRARGLAWRSPLSWLSGCPAASRCRPDPGRRSSRSRSRPERRPPRSRPLLWPAMPDADSLRLTVFELARRLRERILPELGSHAGRAREGGGAGGDVTFAVDQWAEAELEQFVARSAPRMAFY